MAIKFDTKIGDGPDGTVGVEKIRESIPGSKFDVILSIRFPGEYLAAYLTAKEARKIAKALRNGAVGVKAHK